MKLSCYTAVISGRNIIGNDDDIYRYCKEHLPTHFKIVILRDGIKYISKRDLFLVKEEDINRLHLEDKTLNGSPKLHSMRSKGENMKLDIRLLSCLCKGCREGI